VLSVRTALSETAVPSHHSDRSPETVLSRMTARSGDSGPLLRSGSLAVSGTPYCHGSLPNTGALTPYGSLGFRGILVCLRLAQSLRCYPGSRLAPLPRRPRRSMARYRGRVPSESTAAIPCYGQHGGLM
jgi:hypothetical protein